MRVTGILLIFGMFFPVWSQNLFPEDTSFETGTQNFRHFRSELPIRAVQGDAAHGNGSLEIDSAVSWAQGLWSYLKKTPITRSVFMPAAFPAGIGCGSE